ncbi:hypothetical protein MJO28_001069 [Puccinia striiformis f. sp. tritici]|uniref:Uncharacterized protein n=1 Tax=Puccinia striiformis f. sp. tritici TaxID=168172 RepID=A0ACC0EZR3_9BASI|nr:hypothetical protein MJO28_001069 [Puccinia striiformis f. sp. tritici]
MDQPALPDHQHEEEEEEEDLAASRNQGMVQIIRAFQLIQAEQEAISLSVEQQLQLQQQEEQPERRASPAEISTKASSIFAIHRQDGPCSEHSSDQQNSDSDEDDQMETDTKDTLSPHQSSPSDPHPHPSPSYIINQPSDMDSHTPHHHPHELSASLPELTPLNQPSSPVSSKMSNTVTFHTPSSMAPSQYNRRHQHDHQLATKRTQILSNKLQQIFQLPPDEKLLAEYPSWLFRSVLLKGYVYLTTGHVCFYAFLRSNEREVDEDRPTIKAGMLTRRHSGKLNQRQTLKSWFILQDTILSWYSSSHEPFFPIGQIDLHFCTKVEPATPESKTPNQFKLYVSGKVYTFISDTLQSKDEWVKVIQEAVFACQHNGQNVKIAIPLSSIESIEKCDSIQFAQTVCIKTKENATAVPFAQKKQNSPLVPPEEIGDDSLVDYFFGFLQDCQTPYELLKAALERAQAPSSSSDPPPTSQSLTSSSVPSTSIPQILSPIQDSTRFRITSNPVAKHGEDYFANPIIGSPSRSGSQTPISTDTPNLNTEERKTSFKFTDKITRIASTSNKFVGSPIRPAFNTVKVHSPNPISTLGPRPILSSSRPSTPDHLPVPTISTSLPHSSSSAQDQPSKKPLDSPQIDKLQRSSSCKNPLAQSHTYPPKDRRSQYSTYSPRDKLDSPSTPLSTSVSPLATPNEHGTVENSNKSWGLLPGWLKNVPVTLNPIKPAKDVINSARGLISSSPQDPSSPLAPKKEIPSRSPSTEKISDEEGPSRLHQEAQLTPRDQVKFLTDFNSLTPGMIAEGSIRLLLKTKCNLIRSGSSMYGQLYLASPIPFNSLKQKNFRKSCVCFKGQKWISSAPIKMILPVEALTAVRSEGLKLCLTTHQTDVLVSQEDVWFEFASLDQLKAVNEEINRMIEKNKSDDEDESSVDEEVEDEEQEEEEEEEGASLPIMFQSSSSSFLTFKPKSKLHITCLTIGSRGDVQPYIALCQKLQLDGHTCRIASHGEYRKWVEGYGIEYVEIGGDPAELMKICVDNGMFTLGFLKEAFSKFRGWLDELLVSSLDACQGTDLLIESPSTMAGIHIAEALQIPYFRAFTMPWTRTKEYPHAFAVPDRKMGSGYNYMTYTVFDQVFWKAMSGQVNKWRKEKLGLRSTTYEKLEVHKVPFLYNFSPSIVPAPLDWYEWIHVTGYWFIDEHDPNKLISPSKSVTINESLIDPQTSPSSSPIPKSNTEKPSWDPPKELLAFLDRAHSQNKKVVYIGFGSIVVPDPEATTKVIIESVKSAGVYAIISKGWSERLSSNSAVKKGKQAMTSSTGANNSEEETEQQEDRSMIYQINSIPHDWLFPRIDAVCHHGGAGTTGASLKAGIPTIIKPFFGDQFFWAERVETLGIGSGIRKLTIKNLSNALVHATSDLTQISRAKIVGDLIRNEDGAAKAVECIYRDLDYARSLIKRKHNKATEPAASVVPPTAAPLDPSCKPRISLPGRAADLTTDQERRTDGRAGPKENDSQEEEEEGSGGANDSSLLLMSVNSSAQVSDDDDLQTDQSGSSDELLLFEMRNPSTLARSSTPPIPESGPSHTLVGQKSNTTIGPSSQQIDNQNLDNSNHQLHTQNSKNVTQNSSAPTDPHDHEQSSDSSGSSGSWDLLSQQSKSDPASNTDLSTSFDQF